MISYGDIKSGEATMPAPVAPVAKEIGKLPALVEAAAAQLAQAKSAAEVLDAKDKASLIYDAAKRAARLAAAKGAHDTLIAEAHRAQANALKIEAGAKERLADEYDAAQPVEARKGGRPKTVSGENGFTAKEAGISRQAVHDARRVRNAEQARPGVVAETVERALADGNEPTRAMVNAAVAKALGETDTPDARTDVEREADAIVLAWDKASPPARERFLDYLRFVGFTITESNPATGTGGDDVDRSAERASSAVKVGATNSPDGATRRLDDFGSVQDGLKMSSNGQLLGADREPPQSEFARRGNAPVNESVTGGESAATDEESADLGRQTIPLSGKIAPVSNPALVGTNSEMPANPAASPARQATAAPEVTPPPASGATLFNNPRCLKPETCHLKHSRDCCFDCSVAWAQRPKDEQIRLWAEANEAAA
jgi:hypothetical protein